MKKQRALTSFLLTTFFIFSAFLSGCASKKVQLAQSTVDPEEVYAQEKETLEKTKQISPGFTIRIRHSADNEISGEYRVGFNGVLRLPYKVVVKAAGLTTEELAARLEKSYSSYFKANNTVTVEIAAREYIVEVRGLVQKPGNYSVKLDTSLEEIISMAGGLGGGAEGKSAATAAKAEWVRIVKPDFMSASGKPGVGWVRLSDYFAKYDVSNEILWRGGEQLFFQLTGDPEALRKRSTTVQILGEVHKPGEYPISSDTDLYTYITRAGGHTGSADLTNVTIIHKSNNSSDSYDLSDHTKFIDLAPGDLILVKSMNTKQSTIERVAPVALSISSIITSVFLIVFVL